MTPIPPKAPPAPIDNPGETAWTTGYAEGYGIGWEDGYSEGYGDGAQDVWNSEHESEAEPAVHLYQPKTRLSPDRLLLCGKDETPPIHVTEWGPAVTCLLCLSIMHGPELEPEK